MRPDAYIKTVLSVIALCLLWVCMRDFAPISMATAQQRAQRVIITGVSIESGPGILAGAYNSIPVSLVRVSVGPNITGEDNKIPVSLEKVDIVEPVGMAGLSAGGKTNAVPVKLKGMEFSQSFIGDTMSPLPVTINDINLPYSKFSTQKEIPVRVNSNR